MNNKVITALSLVLLGLVVFFIGIQAIPHGRVAGGNMIWVMYFGGCGLLWLCAFLVVRKPST